MSEPVFVFDTTLRDGEQAPGFSLRPLEKLQIARQLDCLGVDAIEAGFAISSPAEADAIRRIASELSRPLIVSLARCHRADVEKAAWALAPAARSRIHVFIATSDLHLRAKLKIARGECLDAATAAVRLARSYTPDVQFSAEDATRTDLEFLCRVVEAVIAAGATTINLPDTVGYATPAEIGEMFSQIRARVPNADAVTLSTHCHNDLGLAVANSLAAVGAGARQVECTINGIGERAGNAALEEVVMAMKVRTDRLPYRVNVDSTQLYTCSGLVSALTGQEVQRNKAVVGRNAFAHEAGIHQDGVLKDRRTYEIMRPEDVGAPSTTGLVLGRHSGRHAVRLRCAHLGYACDGDELVDVYRSLMAVADERKVVTDDDLVMVIHAVRSGLRPRDGAHEVADLLENGYGHGV